MSGVVGGVTNSRVFQDFNEHSYIVSGHMLLKLRLLSRPNVLGSCFRVTGYRSEFCHFFNSASSSSGSI